MTLITIAVWLASASQARLLAKTEDSHAQLAPTRPQVSLTAQVLVDPETTLPTIIQGTMTIRDWTSTAGHCLYLPFNDPNYGDDRGTKRRFEIITGKYGHVPFEGGSTEIELKLPLQSELGPLESILALRLPEGFTSADAITLQFTSRLPRLSPGNDADLFFDGFFPQLLSGCQPAGLESDYYKKSRAADLQISLTLPEGWQYAGPGGTAEGRALSFGMTARNYAFALGRQWQHLAIKAGQTPINLYYSTPGFAALASTLQTVLPTLEGILGPYPYESLTIVQTSDLQRHGLPGLIALNKPRQSLFNHAQKDWLNWQHWIMTAMASAQWYGGVVQSSSPDDEWLTAGLTDFATLEALKHLPERYNLFNLTASGYRFLSFDYLQVTEITAASLRRHAPFATLTTPDFVTRDPLSLQHSLLYIKAAVAFRQLKHYTGEEPFFRFLRNLTAHYLHGDLSPREFRTFIDKLPSPFSPTRRRELKTFLARWWVDEGWPDFALESFRTKDLDGHWVAEMTASQQGEIDFPPMIGVKDAGGRTYAVRAKPVTGESGRLWTAEILTTFKPEVASVDPLHESFDANRFDNTSAFPRVNFFPGSADTLKDDAYTVVWAPYAFRRPGEPFSLGLQGAVFRYIQSGLFFALEGAPSEDVGAGQVRQRFQLPSYALQSDVLLAQNYDGDRVIEASLVRSPLFTGEPYLSVNTKTRNRRRVGQPETAHQTFVLGLSIKPASNNLRCNYNLTTEIEHAPAGMAEGFSYDRSTSSLVTGCMLTPGVDLGIRGFYGMLDRQGIPPEAAFFKPTDLKEARLRLDVRSLAWVPRIAAVNTDLLFPLIVPLPSDSLVLTRQMRGRLFYDYGQAVDDSLIYRSAGVGFLMPFGGDLMGAGSLAITRFSLLAILYTNVNGEVSRKPRVVFDLTGEL